MATQMSEADRVAFIAEANKRAQANGTSVTAELSKAATKNGLSMADAETMMGYPAGTLGGTSSASSNLGMGSNTGSGAYLLDAGKREAAVAEAQRRAKESGRSAEQELYSYAQSQGASNSDLDTYMGINPGGSANFARVNAGRGGIAAPSGNIAGGGAVGAGTAVPEARLPGVGSPEVIPSGDGRWNGDPTRNPDGSYRGGNLGIGDTGYQRNPYLDAMSRDVGSQMFDQWNRNVAPSLRSGAMATGGYGGSRQGVVEANALNDLGRNYSQALTGMYGADYTNYQNRGIQRQGQAQSYDLGRGGLANQRYGQDQSFALGVGGLANQRYGQDQSYSLGLGNLANQRYGQDQSYDLGLRNNDLGFANLDSNIYQNNFNNQLASANFGLGVQDYLNKNNATGVAAGTQINNAPWDYQKYLNSAGNQAGGGWNTSTTTKTGG